MSSEPPTSRAREQVTQPRRSQCTVREHAHRGNRLSGLPLGVEAASLYFGYSIELGNWTAGGRIRPGAPVFAYVRPRLGREPSASSPRNWMPLSIAPRDDHGRSLPATDQPVYRPGPGPACRCAGSRRPHHHRARHPLHLCSICRQRAPERRLQSHPGVPVRRVSARLGDGARERELPDPASVPSGLARGLAPPPRVPGMPITICEEVRVSAAGRSCAARGGQTSLPHTGRDPHR
jgi:hypothetical protein